MTSRRLTPVLLLFFLSGANGLLYQVVWVRQFVHVFGATVLAVSTVLAAFMGGLALGGAWGGRIARRLRRPLRTYGWMELGLALYAGAVPWILVLLDPVYGALNAKLGGSFWMLSTVRFALSTLVLVPPTFAMGATLPILARYAEGGNRAASGVARLYSVNTLGAVAGTVATGFVLLPEIGVLRTLALGVLVNLLLAVTAILLGRREEAGAPRTPEAPRAGETVVRAIPGSLILLTAGVLGFAALSSEILWTRVLSLALGGTAYSFVIVLAVFLLGIAGGSAWAAHLLRGGGSRAQRVFVACPAAIAWLTLALLPVFDRLPGLFMELSARGGGWAGGIAVRAVVAAIPLLPPTFLSGAAFPLAVGILRRDGVSRSVGDVYSANTLGAILGSWAAAFVLIPAFGLRGGLLFGSAVLTASSAVLLLALGSRRTAGMSVALILVTAAGMVGLPDWNRARLTRGGFAVAVDLRRSGAAELGEERGEVVFLEEGITSTITVRRWGGDLSMQMNGVTEASNTKDLVTQVVLGGLGAILHEGPQDVLVIGLGSGITAAAAASHPGVESVDCAEISEAVIRGARWFDEDADHILDDPRLRMIVGDGRNHLRLTDRTYDLIVSEPSNVWNSGVGALMTAEFFELASERLNPGGILVSWIQGYSLSSEALRSVLAAARGSFPRVSLWMGGWGDFMIVAGDARFGIDGERLLRKGRNPEVGKLLARMETPDLLSLLAKNLLAGDAVDRFVDGFPANSDDNLYLEFEAPRLIHKDTMPELFRRLQRNAGGTEQLLVNAPPGLAEALPGVRRAASLDTAARLSFRAGEGVEGMRQAEEAYRLQPASPSTARLLAIAFTGRGEARMRQGQSREAAEDFLRAVELSPADPAPFANLARLHRGEGRWTTACEASDEALRRAPRNPDYLAQRAELHLRMGESEEAARLARAALERSSGNREAFIALGQALDRLGRGAEADGVWATALRRFPEDRDLAHRAAKRSLQPDPE